MFRREFVRAGMILVIHQMKAPVHGMESFYRRTAAAAMKSSTNPPEFKASLQERGIVRTTSEGGLNNRERRHTRQLSKIHTGMAAFWDTPCKLPVTTTTSKSSITKLAAT